MMTAGTLSMGLALVLANHSAIIAHWRASRIDLGQFLRIGPQRLELKLRAVRRHFDLATRAMRVMATAPAFVDSLEKAWVIAAQPPKPRQAFGPRLRRARTAALCPEPPGFSFAIVSAMLTSAHRPRGAGRRSMRRRMAVTITAALFAVVAAPAVAQNSASASRCRAHEVQAQDAGGRHSHGEGDELTQRRSCRVAGGRERLG